MTEPQSDDVDINSELEKVSAGRDRDLSYRLFCINSRPRHSRFAGKIFLPFGRRSGLSAQSKETKAHVRQAIIHGLCSLSVAFLVATNANSSCLPLPERALRDLDAQSETQPQEAIRETRLRLAKATGQQNAVLRAQLYAVLADTYTVLSQPEQAHIAIMSAQDELRGMQNSKGVRSLRLRLDLADAQLVIASSNSAAAVTATSRLLDTLSGDTPELSCTLSMRALAYDFLHQPDLAAKDALLAYRVADNGHWDNARLEAASTLARVFGQAGLYPQAEKMIDVVLSIAKRDSRTELLSTAEYERGMLLAKARRYAEARAAFERANDYALAIGDRFAVAANNATLCWALLREGDLRTADQACNGDEAVLSAGGRYDLAAQLTGNRAHLDLMHNRPAAAIEKLNRILTPTLHALLPRSESEFYYDRARALRELSRLKEADADLIRAHELEEAADGAQRNRQTAVLSAVISSEELAAANRQLQEHVSIQQREVARQREQRQTVSVAGGFIALLLAYLLWISQRHSRALKRQEIILRSAGHHAPDAFWLLDEQRRVRFANRSLCGQGPIPAIGDLVSSALPEALVPTLQAAIDEAFASQQVVSLTATIADLGGTPHYFELFVAPAIDQGRVVGGTLRATDVTEHRELEREVVDGASHERQRLSTELHEGIGQQLAGIMLLLANVLKVVRRGLPQVAHLVEEIDRYVREAIDATRELALGLAPVTIGMGSLSVALSRLAGEAERRLLVQVQCDCQLMGSVLSALAADHLYCICREAVTNAALHGRCKKVTIVVAVEGEILRVSIADDGRGIPSGALDSQGLGMKMMIYRTRLMGGDCQITALPQGGTCVLATVPLDKVSAGPRNVTSQPSPG